MKTKVNKDALPRNTKLPTILFNIERIKFLGLVERFDDLIFCRLGLYSGLRLNEILSITPNDILFNERCVRVMGKGNKERLVPLDFASLQILKCYIHDRGIEPNDKLISLTSRTMENRVTSLADKAGITRIKVTPHTLRHTCCSMLLHRKVPLEITQRIMGHSDVNVTMLYYHTVPSLVTRSYHEALGEGLI